MEIYQLCDPGWENQSLFSVANVIIGILQGEGCCHPLDITTWFHNEVLWLYVK